MGPSMGFVPPNCTCCSLRLTGQEFGHAFKVLAFTLLSYLGDV
jgi:hypothetical protein